jgi:hypothetical protein
MDGDDDGGDDDDDDVLSQFDFDESNHGYQNDDDPIALLRVSSSDQDLSIVSAVDNDEIALTRNTIDVGNIKRAKSAGDLSCCDIRQDDPHHVTQSARKTNKAVHTAVGRVAKTVKSSTVSTGKHVIKGSKKITIGTVKGTVSAGRAAGRVIPVSSVVYGYKQPRKHEPGECASIVVREYI